MEKKKVYWVIAEVILLIVILQCIYEVSTFAIQIHYDSSLFVEKMIGMCMMLVLTIAVLFYSKLRNQNLDVLPKKFSPRYIFISSIISILYIATPSNYIIGISAIITLIYSSIVTPLYEELLFRGYIWNRMKAAISNEVYVYGRNILLFGVWHIGYMIPQITERNYEAVLMKIIAGIGYGAILGFVRSKTKNCYSTFLLHGFLNLFMV